MPEPDIQITDASQTAEELNAKIEAELGLPHEEVIADEPSPEPTDPEDDLGDEEEPGGEEPAGEQPEDDEVVEEPAKKPTEPAAPSDTDLYIEVEDAEGVTHKISKIEDLPEDFTPKNNRQGLEILRQLDKLEQKIEARAADEAKAQEAEALKQTQQEQFEAWDREARELEKQKRIDTKDVERLEKIFDYMNTVNAERAKAGNPNMITSMEDALDKLEAKEAKEAAEEAKKNENDLAKKKASLIGRSSAAAGAASQPYVAGSYRHIDDVPID